MSHRPPSYYVFRVDEWRSVTVPTQPLQAGPEIVNREVLGRFPWVAGDAEQRLKDVLKRELATRGWQQVEETEVWVEEDVMHNQLAYWARTYGADVWEDGCWASARAAVEEDQRVISQHLRGRPAL